MHVRVRDVICGLLLALLLPAFFASAQCDLSFRRADANDDGGIDVSDGIAILNHLFGGNFFPSCRDALDANDDGGVDVSDAISVFIYLFAGGAAPPAPGVNCGVDPTEDNLGCEEYRSCPQEEKCTDGNCCPTGFFCRKEVGDCDGPGVCREIPTDCPENFDPVCGCDGETYANECFAAAAGVSVAYRGDCRPAECRTNSECPEGSFCLKTVGACEDPGVCAEQPSICTAIYDPVCGCDGQTYSNECEAHASGVSVMHEGECDIGIECRSNPDCPNGTYCKKLPEECDSVGACVSVPVGCPDNVDPVCGCDGVTYGNPCEAAAVGVSILHFGPCDPDRDCNANSDCALGSYCAKPESECDAVGRCELRPTECTEEYDPVCGCDGNTYSNACHAAEAGVSVLHRGECEPSNSCARHFQCGDGFFCQKATGDCEGEGECALIPEGCPENIDPVCGCDGNTYNNECEAHAAGVNVLHKGQCDPKCSGNIDCSKENSYCRKEVGDCEGEGVCEQRPVLCTQELDPVCGCDGETYPNECEARRAGASVAHEGECEDNGRE